MVKIVDFGLTKLAGRTMLTKEGTTLATASYMSPEQTQGAAVDHRTDIWALSVVLYEMVTGKQPFRGDYEQAVLYSIMNENPEPITGLRTSVPMELERVVNKALAKNPDERYQRVDELLVDLKTLKKQLQLGTAKVLATSGGAIEPSRKKINHGIPLGGVAGVAVLALIVINFLMPSKSGSIDRRSIAVLPFENLNDPESDYFSDGITEDILTQLSKIGDLRVFSSIATKQYKGSQKGPREIGQELAVATLLAGKVRQAGVKLRISCQLINCANESQIWAETYDREMRDVFAIQSDVARQIANTLKADSPRQKRNASKAARPQTSLLTIIISRAEIFTIEIPRRIMSAPLICSGKDWQETRNLLWPGQAWGMRTIKGALDLVLSFHGLTHQSS